MNVIANSAVEWYFACHITDVPHNGGVCVKVEDTQIALFHFAHRDEWFASDNECPHRKQMAISRGMLGSHHGEPKVACPFHKKTFSLTDGRCLNSEEGLSIRTYPVKVEEGKVFINIAALNQPFTSTIQTDAYEDQTD
ncbi:nitrite reductase small subunit NirD [Terrimonas sp. NA20]|uniref:Nitrite reductase small subunit NirD n=1 Tax=Terrimonas ginsenosidimutans TaxID=2908004 RepID=A0ABS9KMH7_9BACT|nr:nitrite reductase small subunit NirD [Terrimonas ginsenosidimutans]MCG2613508.1 nitrite reductase small subunit NirD [Terrimonas ginsenosidimutans]